MKFPKKSVIILIVVLILLLGALAKQILLRRKPLPKKAPIAPVAQEVRKEVPSEKEEIEKKPLIPREGPRRENPFTPLIGKVSPEEEKVLPERREVLVLTGVVMGREPTAIIEGPRGDYYVKVGEAIGSKKVIEIAPDRVVLLEGEKRITLKLRGE